MFADLKIRDFTEKLASDSATPGGGTASALAGSMSASLLSMVMRISIRKITDESIVLKMQSHTKECDRKSKEFLALMDKDAEAFDEVMKAYKLPKNTKEAKEERKSKIQIALKSAALTPLKTMEVVHETVLIAKDVMAFVPGSVVSDIGVSALMARSALKGAYYNVMINVKYIKDEEFCKDMKEKADSIKHRTEELLNYIDAEIEKIMEGKKK